MSLEVLQKYIPIIILIFLHLTIAFSATIYINIQESVTALTSVAKTCAKRHSAYELILRIYLLDHSQCKLKDFH